MPPKDSTQYSLPALRGAHTVVIESKISLWKSILDVIKEFIDEIVLEVTPRGLVFQTFDKMSAALLNLNMSPNMFTRFDVSNPAGPVTPVEIKINVVELLKVIKCGSDSDMLRLSIKEADPDTLIVNIVGTTKARFTLACLDYVDTNRVEPQDLGLFDHHEVLNIAEFTQIVKSIRTFGEATYINLCQDGNEAQCIMSTSGESVRKAEFMMKLAKADNQNCEVFLSNDYLVKVAKVISLAKDTFTIHMNNEGNPCVFVADLNDGLGEIVVYVSQREMY